MHLGGKAFVGEEDANIQTMHPPTSTHVFWKSSELERFLIKLKQSGGGKFQEVCMTQILVINYIVVDH